MPPGRPPTNFDSPEHERMSIAAKLYVANGGKGTQEEFFKKELPDIEYNPKQFNGFVRGARPDFQALAKEARETGIIPKFDTKYKDGILKCALKVFDVHNKRDTKIHSTVQATSSNSRDNTPDVKVLQASLTTVADAFKSFQVQVDDMSKALGNKNKKINKLEKENKTFEGRLEEICDKLEDEREKNTNLTQANKRLRDQISKSDDSSEVLARKRQKNKRLKRENAELKARLAYAMEAGNRQDTTTDMNTTFSSTNNNLQEELCKLRAEKERLASAHRRATEALSFQTSLLQEERFRRKEVEDNLQTLTKKLHQSPYRTVETPEMVKCEINAEKNARSPHAASLPDCYDIDI